MQAAFYSGPSDLELREVPVPDVESGEVLLHVRACSICGSDLQFYRGDLPQFLSNSPGHEFSGEIAKIGPNVKKWKIGDRVTVDPLRSCQNCEHCNIGDVHYCSQKRLMGVLIPGGLTEFVKVPSHAIYSLPDDVRFDVGALIEPLAVVIHGLHNAGFESGQNVLVMGVGGIGALTILAARFMDAGEITAVYKYPQQRKMALDLGADNVFGHDTMPISSKRRSDVAVETTGNIEKNIQIASSNIATGGSMLLLGMSTSTISIKPMQILLSQMQIIPSLGFCHGKSDFDNAILIAKEKSDQMEKIISHKFPLLEIKEAFDVANNKGSGSIKVVVNP